MTSTTSSGRISSMGSLELPTSADRVVRLTNPDDLLAYVLAQPPAKRAGLVVAGELSNTVVGERLPAHVVLFRDGAVLEQETSATDVRLRVAASCSLDQVVQTAVALGFPGLELLSGIPGTVGAAVVQNVAAYGQHFSDVFTGARVVERSSGRVRDLSPADLEFSYRSSRLKSGPGYTPDEVLLDVHLVLPRRPPLELRYADLQRRHAAAGRSPDDLAARRASVLEVREKKGMVWCGQNWVPSAGSFFVGPVVPPARALAIAQSIRGTEFADGFLSWYQPDRGNVRLPAALAIRAAGFMNGDRWGPVGLSPHHILALSNFDGARGGQVLALAQHITDQVQRVLGVQLHREVKVLGQVDESPWDEHVRLHGFQPGAGEPAWARDMGRPS